MSDPALPYHNLFMRKAHALALQSPDLRTKVGAVVVHNSFVLAGGFNRPPASLAHCSAALANREDFSKLTKYDITLHAERVAIDAAGLSARGGHVYCTHHCCAACATLLAEAGITTFFYHLVPDTDSLRVLQAREIFREAKITAIQLPLETP